MSPIFTSVISGVDAARVNDNIWFENNRKWRCEEDRMTYETFSVTPTVWVSDKGRPQMASASKSAIIIHATSVAPQDSWMFTPSQGAAISACRGHRPYVICLLYTSPSPRD